MPISLEVPKQFDALVYQANQAAAHILRPNSRKYDLAEHENPKELDALAALLNGIAAGDPRAAAAGAGATSGVSNGNGAAAANGNGSAKKKKADGDAVKNGGNLASVLAVTEMSWGDVGLLLAMPRQGLGQAAIAAVATPEQLERFGGRWAAMAITEPEAGSDSAAIKTSARFDEETQEWVLNGEKIYVTSGHRAELIVVWATLDRSKGRGAIKSFVVERDTPGLHLERLEEKLGCKASDTAAFHLKDVRVPKENLLGSPEIQTAREGFSGVMKTFDNTRPLVAAMAVGVAKAALQRARELFTDAGLALDYDRPLHAQSGAAAEFIELEAEWEAARLLALRAAWMADNKKPNTVEASMSKAKAGRVATDICLRVVKLAGAVGYAEHELLEKWARDVKILDIFEGTQQIQQLVIARNLLGKSSAELK
ncbi:MAG TPA: acyl-CoA dehydrogenase family protein [Solirubrobacteraceae bacterium]|nr:acyl-CoA dehydrogenase family protein [Solirubrobacteraceae bacterium]